MDKEKKDLENNLDNLEETKPVIDEQNKATGINIENRMNFLKNLIPLEATMPQLAIQHQDIEPFLPIEAMQTEIIPDNAVANIAAGSLEAYRQRVDSTLEIMKVGMVERERLFNQEQLYAFARSLENLNQSVANAASAAISAIEQTRQMMSNALSLFMENVVQNNFASLFSALGKGLNEYKGKYLNIMYDARWSPHFMVSPSLNFLIDINDIVSSTRKSKSRTKKIDSCVFSYYNRTTIDSIKKQWGKLGLKSELIRILRQAVKAYNNREYAITTIVLTTLWEHIISEKAPHIVGKGSEKSKDRFSCLAELNDLPTIQTEFFSEYIMYKCYSADEVKEDVPGRHGVAHGLLIPFYSRKMALNSIIFTDLLLRLEPIAVGVDEAV